MPRKVLAPLLLGGEYVIQSIRVHVGGRGERTVSDTVPIAVVVALADAAVTSVAPATLAP